MKPKTPSVSPDTGKPATLGSAMTAAAARTAALTLARRSFNSRSNMAACLLSGSALRSESAALVAAPFGADVAAAAIEVDPLGRVLRGSERGTPGAVTLAPKTQASASTDETNRRVDMGPPVERPVCRREA